MSDNSLGDGYFTGIDYTAHYFRDLNPLRAEFTLLVEGLDTPPPGPCCELGFGQGVSLAMHAAGDTSRGWWGTDLMASHARHAQQLVSAAGVPATAADQSFADFCARTDLPQFAFIGLHGVWSWVSAANRALIADFLRRRLMPGGVVYLCYNVLPAWTPLLPLRSLMTDHERCMGTAAQPAADRVRAAAAFVDQVLSIDSPMVRNIPGMRAGFGKEAAKAPEYLLHEYMNRDWHHTTLVELAAQLEPAQLTWGTSTELLNRLENICLTPDQQKFLAGVSAPLLRESARDLFVGQGLRRDIFVRGARRLPSAEQTAPQPGDRPDQRPGGQGHHSAQEPALHGRRPGSRRRSHQRG
jgi:Predicted methyltransferase regulatory domain